LRKIITEELSQVVRLATSSVSPVRRRAAPYERLAGRALDPLVSVIASLRPKVQMENRASEHRRWSRSRHTRFYVGRRLPLDQSKGIGPVPYIVRNRLDVAVSYAELKGQTIDLTIEQMASSGFRSWSKNIAYMRFGSWSENVKSWTEPAHPIVLVLRYEDMSARPWKE